MIGTVKQVAKKHRKAKKSALTIRKELWPDLEMQITLNPAILWNRNVHDGFTSIPRTMPLLMNLINDLSKHVTDGKSVPAGRSYFVLWCRGFDESLVQIENESTLAFEAGYTGERNVTTWREHLKVLQKLGFIEVKEGPNGPYQYVLILNPYEAIQKLKAKEMIQTVSYMAFLQRSLEIGAIDGE
jgi:hypothetical protein